MHRVVRTLLTVGMLTVGVLGAVGCGAPCRAVDGELATAARRAPDLRPATPVDRTHLRLTLSTAALQRLVEAQVAVAVEELTSSLGALRLGNTQVVPRATVRVGALELSERSGDIEVWMPLEVELIASAAGVRAGAHALVAIEATLAIEHFGDASSVVVDAGRSRIATVDVRAVGAGQMTQQFVDAAVGSLTTALNTGLLPAVGRQRLADVGPFQIEQIRIPMRIREARVLPQPSRLELSIVTGLDVPDASGALPLAVGGGDIAMVVSAAFARGALAFVLAQPDANVGTGGATLRASVETVGFEGGRIQAGYTGYRCEAPCGSAQLESEFDVDMAESRVEVRIVEHDLVASSRPRWATERQMPSGNQIAYRVSSLLNLMFEARPIRTGTGLELGLEPVGFHVQDGAAQIRARLLTEPAAR